MICKHYDNPLDAKYCIHCGQEFGYTHDTRSLHSHIDTSWYQLLWPNGTCEQNGFRLESDFWIEIYKTGYIHFTQKQLDSILQQYNFLMFEQPSSLFGYPLRIVEEI